MKVFCVLGSPRKKGNTAKVLGWAEEELRTRGHEIEHINITDYNIEGCIGCYKCQVNPDQLECSHNDQGVEIFGRMKDAGAIIYATPLYCWGFTAQIKPFIDRHLCLATGYGDLLTHKSHIENKRAALLVTAAGETGEGNTDLIEEVFNRLMGFTKSRVLAKLIVPLCTEPGALGNEQKEMAHAFAEEILA